MTAPDIRAQAIEVLARELFAVDADLAGYGPDDFEDWAPRYHRKAEPYVDALAEAGLLPTPSAGYTVLASEDSGYSWLATSATASRTEAEERVAYLRGGDIAARVVELREVAE